MPTVRAKDGTGLYVNDWGRGRPIVLIHGWPLNADMWEYQAPLLGSRGFRVVSYDRRGFGRSDKPWGGYDYDTLADDLKAVIDDLGLDDAILVGFSMGGGEVARYLSRHGAAKVGGAVLVSSVVPLLVKTSDNKKGVDPAMFDDMVVQLNQDRPAFLAGFGLKFFGGGPVRQGVSPEMMTWTQMLALQASPKATIDCVRAFSETDFRRDLPAFEGVRTLVIHGDADQVVPYKTTSKAVADALPHADLAVYKGAPHALFVTEKARLNADLLAFASER